MPFSCAWTEKLDDNIEKMCVRIYNQSASSQPRLLECFLCELSLQTTVMGDEERILRSILESISCKYDELGVFLTLHCSNYFSPA